MKRVLVFPGQGAQYVGMGKDFLSFSVVKETFEEANDLLQENLSKVFLEGPESDLIVTKNSQLAIFVVSVALFRVLLQQHKLSFDTVSGLSLGEYTALFAAGKLSFKEALLLIQRRAMFMNEACRREKGAMAAVLGLESSKMEELLSDGLWIANYNSPGQIVITGRAAKVEKVLSSLKEAGAKRVVSLAVDGAFHSPLMQVAEEKLTPYIQAAPIVDTPIAIVMNAPGDFSSYDQLKENLSKQMTHPVRWEQGVRKMIVSGIDHFLEIGPGKTLTALLRKIAPQIKGVSLEKITDLEGVIV